jgi:hypothetical protein
MRRDGPLAIVRNHNDKYGRCSLPDFILIIFLLPVFIFIIVSYLPWC